MIRAMILGALAALALASEAVAAPRDAALRAAVEGLRRSANVPAAGVAVIDRGRVIFVDGFGEIDGRPATGDDRFRAASVSKLFTAQTVMKLADQGRLQLDDDVGRWVPAFQGRGLTLRHLLTHHSGLRDLVLPVETDDPARLAAYLDILAKLPTAAAPGAAYSYTDSDFNLLGAVVAAASGEPYDRFVQRAILDPLKLSQTSIFPPRSGRTGIAPPFLNKPAVRPATPRAFDIAFAPSEGLVTSARDLAVWTAATLNRDPRLLRKASFDTMITGHENAERPGRYIGLGWQLYSQGERQVAEHAGSVRGYNALVFTYWQERRAFVILTNAEDAPRWEMVKALDAALGPP